jgi:hypothetical protein
MGTRNCHYHSAFSYQIGENIMNDLDHMLNGKGSRDHLQDMIQQAQQAKFAREAKAVSNPRKMVAPLRTALASIINLVMRLG